MKKGLRPNPGNLLTTFFIIYIILVINPAAYAGRYYVSTQGNDANTGLDYFESAAWKTIDHAASNVGAGDTVVIRPGIYMEEINVDSGGTLSNQVYFIGDTAALFFPDTTAGEVVIDGDSTYAYGFKLDSTDYVNITGFTFKAQLQSSIYLDPSNAELSDISIYRNVFKSWNIDSLDYPAIELNGTSSYQVWYINIYENRFQGGPYNLTAIGSEGAGDLTRNEDVFIYNNVFNGVGTAIALLGDNDQVWVYDNYIYDAEYGVYLNTINNGQNKFYNNVISSTLFVSYAFAYYNTGTTDTTDIFNNSINLNGFGFYSNSTTQEGLRLVNNIFRINDTRWAVYMYSNSQAREINNNQYYMPNGGKIGRFNGVNYDTLANWMDAQPSKNGNDTSSRYGDPLYADASKLTLEAGSPAFGSGIPITAGTYGFEISDDIRDTIRDATYPTIGAYELTRSEGWLIDSITDNRDGQVYEIIKIGDQWWMRENLRYGTVVSSIKGQSDNDTIEQYVYNDDSLTYYEDGGIYLWDEMMQYKLSENGLQGTTRGVCPDGWHIPTDNEWQLLEDHLGMSPADTGNTTWRGIDQGTKLKAGEISGFEAMFNGRYSSGTFKDYSSEAYFWTSTESSGTNAYSRRITSSDSRIYRYGTVKVSGHSVRCVKSHAVSGTFTIGGTSPDFASLNEAVSYLRNGYVSGSVTFNIRNGTYTEQVEIPQIVGASDENRITFQSESGDSTGVTISYTPTVDSAYVIYLNGADYINLKEIGVKPLGTSFANGIVLDNGAHQIGISNCHFEGDNGYGYLIRSDGSIDSNLVIQHSYFYNGFSGIYLFGENASYTDAGIRIHHNQLIDFETQGIRLGYTVNARIYENQITRNLTTASFTGITSSTLRTSEIYNNRIVTKLGEGILLSNGGGSSATGNLLYNNIISIGDAGASDGYGIYLQNGGYNEVYHNTVANYNQHASSAAIYIPSGSYNYLKNNIFAQFGEGYAIRTGTETVLSFSDYNSFYSEDTLTENNGIPYTLNDWQTYVYQDYYSIAANPLFTDSIDLIPTKCLLKDLGIQLDTIVPWDINGVSRDASPDPGATEFTTASLSGTYTVGTGGDYKTLKDAFDALKGCGISGPVTLELSDAVYNEPSIIVDTLPGLNENDSILLRPAAGVDAVVNVDLGAAHTVGFSFTDVSHLTIDGSNDGSESRDLEFVFTGNYNNSITLFQFIPDWMPVEDITIKNTVITGYNNSYENTNTAVYFDFSGRGSGYSSNYITLENNEIRRVKDGIYMEGYSTQAAKHNSIINNRIGHPDLDSTIRRNGIRLFNQDSLLVSGNRIFNIIDTTTSYDVTGMDVSGIKKAEIRSNTIQDVVIPPGNTGYGATGMRVSFDESIDALIVNNVISHIAAPGGNGAGYDASGLVIYDNGASNNSANIDVYHNSIYLSRDTTNGFSIGNSYAVALYLENYVDSVVDLRNNILEASLGNKNGYSVTSGGYAIYNFYEGTPVKPFEYIDHNQYFASGHSVDYIAFSEDTLFSDIHRFSAYTGGDSNSYYLNPKFEAADKPVPQKWNVFADAGGVDLGISEDIAGSARGVNPDMGAWEFNAFSELSGHISANTTISDSIVVTDTLWIDNGAAVEVEPGTYVQVVDKDTMYVPVIVNGRMDVNGLPGDTVRFASYGSKNWGGIHFESDADDASLIDHAIIETGNYGTDTLDALSLNEVGIAVTNTVLNGNHRSLLLTHSTALIDSTHIISGDGIGVEAINEDSSMIQFSIFKRESALAIPVKIDSSTTSLHSNLFTNSSGASGMYSIHVEAAAGDTVRIDGNTFNLEHPIETGLENAAVVEIYNNTFNGPVAALSNNSGEVNVVNNVVYFPATYVGLDSIFSAFYQSVSRIDPVISSYNNTVYNKSSSEPVVFSATTGQGLGQAYIDIRNTIVWGFGTDPVDNDLASDIDVNYSNIQSYSNLLSGTANLDTFPGFVDTTHAGLDLRLTDTSLMINAGDPEFTVDSLGSLLDLDLKDRITNDTIDMGAYEYQFPAPNPPTGLTAKTIFKDRIDLSWNDQSGNEEGFVILRSSVDSNSVVAMDSVLSNVTSYVDTNVALSTAYYYRLASFGYDLNSDTTGAAMAHTAISYYTNASITQDTLWNTDTVKLTGHVTVYDGVTLTIDPGLYVEMQDSAEITIYGTLLAQGTEADSITFTVKDTTGYATGNHTGWAGIKFIDVAASNDTSRLDYTIITYSHSAAIDANTLLEGILSNSRISHNARGLKLWSGTEMMVRNNTITWNKTNDEAGAGIYINSSTPVIQGNLITNNVANGGVTRHGGGIFSSVDASPVIVGNTIRYNESGGLGAGMYIHSSGYIDSNLVEYNLSGSSGGGVYLNSFDSLFTNNTIRYNEGSSAGGLYITNIGTADILNNTISFNKAGSSGGGVYITQTDTTLHFIQNLIHHNEAYTGGGIAFSTNTGDLRIASNTIASNQAGNKGGGVAMNSTTADFNNNIIYFNTLNGSGNQIHLSADVPGDLTFNNLEDGVSGITGGFSFTGSTTGNLAMDPLFADTTAYDYALTDCSPSVNAGVADTTGMGIPPLDYAGNPRIHDGTIDQGVLEYQGTAMASPEFIYFAGDSVLLEGADLQMAAVVSGDSLSYQWEESLDGGATWNSLPGETDSILNIVNLPASYDGYQYRIILSGYCPPTDTSFAVMLQVSVPPTLSLDVDTLNFIPQPPAGKTDTLLFYLYNTGDDTLFIDSTSALGFPFTEVFDTSYILAHDSVKADVLFDRNNNPGNYMEVLYIYTSDTTASVVIASEIQPFIEPGNALVFDDGNSQYVNIPDHNDLDLTSNYTLEAWFKVNEFTDMGGIISKFRSGGSGGYSLKLLNGPPYDGLFFDGKYTEAGLLETDQWYHVAGVNDNGTRRLYLNGKEVELPSGFPTSMQENTDDLAIGLDYTGRYFNGNIDEVRIWNQVRTQEEIRSGMHESLAGSESGLVAYYDFDRVLGDSLPDGTTQAHDGVLMNMADSSWVPSGALIIPFADSASETGSSGFVAQWDSIPAATGYILDVAADSSFTQPISGYDNLDVPGMASYTVSGLSPGHTYYYRVRSKTGTDTSEWSNVIQVNTGTSSIFDFNNLATGDLGGQDGWVTQQYGTSTDMQVKATDGFDGTQAVAYEATGPSYGADASILLDGAGTNGFAFDDMNAMYRLSFDEKENYWGIFFVLGPDLNSDGFMTRNDSEEIALQVRTQNHTADKLQLPDGTQINEDITAPSAWNRVEMIVSGLQQDSGKVSVRVKELGTDKWKIMADEVDLGLDTTAPDKSNIKLWNTLMFHIEGGTGIVDNVELKKVYEGKMHVKADSLDFGTQVEAPDTDTLSFRLYNTGNDMLSIDSIGGIATPFTYMLSSATVPVDDSARVDLILDKNNTGTYIDTMTVYSRIWQASLKLKAELVPANESPVASDDLEEICEETSIVVDVLANDSDADSDPLITSVLELPSNGTANLLNSDSIEYIPDAGFSGNDTIIYEVSDGEDSDTAELVISVNALPVIDLTNDTTICEGETITLSASGGDTYLWSTSGNTADISVAPTYDTLYSVMVTGVNGCMKEDTVNVYVNPVDSTYEYVEICEGENYLGYDSTGIYYETFTNRFGCDSVVEIDVWVNDVDTIYDYAAICEGENYLGYDSTGVYYETYSDRFGCDSVIEIEVVVNETDSTYLYGEICQGSNFMGYDSTGIYYETFTNRFGCDSIVEIEVVVTDTIIHSVDAFICEGETYTLPDGEIVDSGGTYTDSLITALGCDSIVTTYLTVHPMDTTYDYAEICTGESYLGYDSTGIYYETYSNRFGCDSVVEIDVWVNDVDTSYDYAAICEGENYLGYDSTGIYYETYSNRFGCDSVVEIEVVVNETDSTYLYGEICSGEEFMGYSEGGTFTEYYTNRHGCDSIVFIEVIEHPLPLADAGDDLSIIKGDSVQLQASGGMHFQWNNAATLSGDTIANPWARPPDTTKYYLRVRDEFGCESVDSITISVVLPLDNQELTLREGWNMFSLNVEPSKGNMLDLMQPLIDTNALVKVQDEAGNALVNLEGTWVDFIGAHKASEGYQIRLAKNADLNVTGVHYHEPVLVNLIKGWNIVSYPGQSPKNAELVLSSLLSANYLKKAQDDSGASMEQVDPLGWINNIGNFEPGEGYKIRVNSNAYLSYGKQQKSGLQPEYAIPDKNTHFKKAWQGNGYNHMNIYVKDIQINGMPIMPGDEIAVFDGTICVGRVVFDAYRYGYIPIAVSMDDPETIEQDGFIPGNAVRFKVWNSQQEMEMEQVAITNLDSNTLVFKSFGSGIVKLKANDEATGMHHLAETPAGLGECYPNPFSEQLTVHYTVGKDDKVKLEIYDLLGNKVITLLEGMHKPGKYRIEWDRRGADNAVASPGIYLLRLKTGMHSEIKRITIY